MAKIPVGLPNTADDYVDEMLFGLEAAYPGAMKVHFGCGKLIVETLHRNGCVTVFSGGRAGYEPFPAGFVGSGMLSAALYGQNFNSPTSDEVSKSIKLIAGGTIGGEILVIIPNNLPDRLNFGSGVEKARSDGSEVASVLIGENYAHPYPDSHQMSMKVICATIFIFKIAGAMSLAGKSLNDIVSTINKISSSMATFEVYLSPYSLTVPVFTLEEVPKDQEMEAHKECCELNDHLSRETIFIKLNKTCDSIGIKQGDEVAILVNNLDPIAKMAQWILVEEICKELSKNEVKVLRIYTGNLVSFAGKSGLQVCILNFGKYVREKEEWLCWLDMPTLAPAWPGGSRSIASTDSSFSFVEFIIQQNIKLNKQKSVKNMSKVGYKGAKLIRSCVEAATRALIFEEDRLNSWGTKFNDGDSGTILKNGAEAILEKLDALPMDCPAALLSCLANLCESHMAGLSGVIYSLLFTAAIPPLNSVSTIENNGKDLPWAEAWGKAWRSGLNGICRYYKPKTGNKTMLDVLEFCCSRYEWSSKKNNSEVLLALDFCLPAADDGCKSKGMICSKSRKSHVVGQEWLGYNAEACGVLVWLKAIMKVIKHNLP